MISFRHQIGLSLFEGLLVGVIASFFIVMGLTFYQRASLDNQVLLLKNNVTQLFQAAAAYYYTNCSTGKLLDPALLPPNPTAVIKNGINSLFTSGYLKQWPLPNASIIDTSVGNQGYFVQYYMLPPAQYSVYACANSGSFPCTPSTPQAIQSAQNTVYIWSIQVAVKPLNTALIDTLKIVLGASCRTDVISGGIAPCSQNKSGDYLVWENLPFLGSPLSPNMIVPSFLIKQFNLQYTHDPMYELTNAGYASTQYYLCGG